MPAPDSQPRPSVPSRARLKVALRGAVQGVGFRPFVHRLATELGLAGWVNNSPQGVFMEVEGERMVLDRFLERLHSDKPALSFIQSTETTWLDPLGGQIFEIRASDTAGDKTALVLPDIATCPDCLRELLDPRNRRFRYPFINCTHCGPRFSIIESLPYDRPNTAMKRFAMCPRCQAEYDDPRDRRFHAQPNACPVCGPHLQLWDRKGKPLPAQTAGAQPSGCSSAESSGARPQQSPASSEHPMLLQPKGCAPVTPDQPCASEASREALLAAAEAIRQGQIVAVKGLGGFHLMVAAHNDYAVRRLRELKHREEKPFALMFPSLPAIKAACEVSPLEERLLRSIFGEKARDVKDTSLRISPISKEAAMQMIREIKGIGMLTGLRGEKSCDLADGRPAKPVQERLAQMETPQLKPLEKDCPEGHQQGERERLPEKCC